MSADLTVNPYNFQVPVSAPMAFAGRTSQRKEIEYYLDQALTTRPTNVAIVGPRAAGKTSLLNMIAHDAASRGVVVVRINFDESHSRSQLRFFFKIFDSLVSEIVKHTRQADGTKCFGGRGGQFFELYTSCIATFERAKVDDLELIFPNLYASAMRASNADGMIVSQSLFEDDLRRVSNEVGRPIALIMDECNVFVQNREILQAMRGMFQNLDRYMLIMTGTNEMFPVIDDVYSPVGRGFKRISVEGFVTPLDTYACMERPCRAHDISTDLLRRFRPSTSSDGVVQIPDELEDLHRFTSGSPHEIQLACHFMFRDVQGRYATRGGLDTRPSEVRTSPRVPPMQLASTVIARVLRELAPDESRRATLNRLQSLRVSTLQALGLLSRVGFGFSRGTYCGFVESERALAESGPTALSRRERLTTAEFGAGIDELLGLGWLQEVEGAPGFKWIAPQLEEVLVKYVARSKGVLVGAFGVESMLPFYLQFVSALRWPSPWIATLPNGAVLDGMAAVPERVRGRALHVWGEHMETIQLACLTPERGWTVIATGLANEEGETLDPARFERTERSVANANLAAEQYGVRWSLIRMVHHSSQQWGSVATDWTDPLSHIENLGCLTWMPAYHDRVRDEFLRGGDVGAVIQLLVPKWSELDSEHAANFGFMALAYGMRDARACLAQVVSRAASPLRRYNLALAALYAEPDGVNLAIEELKSINGDETNQLMAMLCPKWEDGVMKLEEWRHMEGNGDPPPLGSFVTGAIDALEKALGSGQSVTVISARQSAAICSSISAN